MSEEEVVKAEKDAGVDLPINTVGVSMSADAVSVALDKWVEDGTITAGDKGLVLWFFGYVKERGLSCADAAKLIAYNPATVSRLFRANYEGSVTNIIRAIRRLKHITDERGKMVQDTFIDTSIWRDIRATCDLALMRHAPVRIVGVSQIGKTCALKEYQRRSEFLVRYCRLPAAPGFRGVLEAVADSCYVTTRCTTEQLRRRVAKSLDENTLLIIDELHQLAISSGVHSAMKVMEWIRELYDESGCGLVVCGTRAMEDDLIKGELKSWLDQFDQRCIRVLELPTQVPDEDICAAAKAYRLPEPDDDTLIFLRTLRMNRLCLMLRCAAELAQRRQASISWDLAKSAYRTLFGGK